MSNLDCVRNALGGLELQTRTPKTNVHYVLCHQPVYVTKFSERFEMPIRGEGGPMQTCTNREGLTIINFGIGSANAATIMDLLSARHPRGVLFLGKCGGLKRSTEIGRFILPIAAIRGEGTTTITFHPRCPPCLHLNFTNSSQIP